MISQEDVQRMEQVAQCLMLGISFHESITATLFFLLGFLTNERPKSSARSVNRVYFKGQGCRWMDRVPQTLLESWSCFRSDPFTGLMTWRESMVVGY